MTSDEHSPEDIEQALREQLQNVVESGGKQQQTLAAYLLDHPEEIAFRSVRSLAQQAGVTSSAVVRLSKALGFEGFEACRAAFQHAMRRNPLIYAKRAAALSGGSLSDRRDSMETATLANVRAVYERETAARIDDCADELLSARRVVVFGVRSCFAVGYFFSYLGRMAFDHIEVAPQGPSGVFDAAAELQPGDIVVAVAYEHYSAEVVRACEIARIRGARVLAITDSQASPIAIGAWRTLAFSTAGPHFTPSLVAAFALCEELLAAMVAKAPDAAQRVRELEERRKALGGYI